MTRYSRIASWFTILMAFLAAASVQAQPVQLLAADSAAKDRFGELIALSVRGDKESFGAIADNDHGRLSRTRRLILRSIPC
jgi:hypothetical protein